MIDTIRAAANGRIAAWTDEQDATADRLIAAIAGSALAPSQAGRKAHTDTRTAQALLSDMAAVGEITASGHGAWTRYCSRSATTPAAPAPRPVDPKGQEPA